MIPAAHSIVRGFFVQNPQFKHTESSADFLVKLLQTAKKCGIIFRLIEITRYKSVFGGIFYDNT